VASAPVGVERQRRRRRCMNANHDDTSTVTHTWYYHVILVCMTDCAGIGRKVAVVNLDPANDTLPYTCSVDISELITLSDVMDLLHLGPNGGLVYCMEYLERNIDWLQGRLLSSDLNDHYLLFDCPGQVELYTHNNCVRRVFSRLSRDGYRLAVVHLADAHYCTEPSKFVSVLLTSLTAMLQVINTTGDADSGWYKFL